MGWQNQRVRRLGRHHGFTVVELLVVIMVLGIITAIGIVSYSGYQMRVRDAERRSDLTQLTSGLKAYALQKNNFMGTGSGCGLSNNGIGWISVGPADNSLYSTKSVIQCLKDAGAVDTIGNFIDPSGCKSDTGGTCGSWRAAPAKAYMKANCQKGGREAVYFMAHLESQPRRDTEIDGLCDAGTMVGFDAEGQKWGTNYGMNHYEQVR